MDPEAAQSWMQQALKDSVALARIETGYWTPDTTIKSLYGHQEDSEVGCNPHKPGRPSHALHTYWVGNLRLVLDMQLRSGKEGEQQVLALGWDEVQEEVQLWEYTVLVTYVAYELGAIGQIYRDRCDFENGFDELKNQWGWGGFTTQDMHRSELTARAVVLVYNGWSWHVRAANPQARCEALTSRPLLLAAVGRATHSGGRTELHPTPMHAELGLIKTMITNIQAAIAYGRRAAEQLPKVDRWRVLPGYICERITRQTVLPSQPPTLAGVG